MRAVMRVAALAIGWFLVFRTGQLQPPMGILKSRLVACRRPSALTITRTVPDSATLISVDTQGSAPGPKVKVAASGCGLRSVTIDNARVSGIRLVT
jgi:hypothetical protein